MTRPAEKPENVDVEALLTQVAQLSAENRLLRSVKCGIVWQDRPEKAEEALRESLPVFTRRTSLDVRGANPSGRPHVLIEGDNLHALTALQATHREAVDVIYIDPPYNTGKEFTYNDKLVSEDDEWKHSSWLSFMNKRLLLARDLLKETGVILISIDDNEQAGLRLLCDRIFGEQNFIATLVWDGSRKGNVRHVSSGHDYILVFAKSKPAIDGTRWRAPKPEAQDILDAAKSIWAETPDAEKATAKLQAWFKERKNKNQDDPVLDSKDYKYIDEDGEVYRLTPPDTADGYQYDVIHPVTGQVCRAPGGGRGWAWSESEMADRIARGDLIFKFDHTGLPMGKLRLRDALTAAPKSVFYAPRRGAASQLKSMLGPSEFDYPKPPKVLARWLGMVAGPNALVLDFFAGSGSTAEAVCLLNAADGGDRQAILVTNNENNICRQVTQRRMKAALTGEWANGKPHAALPGSLIFLGCELTKRRRNPDALLLDLAKAAEIFLSLSESAFLRVLHEGPLSVVAGDDRVVAIVTEPVSEQDVLVRAAENTPESQSAGKKTVYVFTWSDLGVESEIADEWEAHGWVVKALPAPVLAALRNAINTAERNGGF